MESFNLADQRASFRQADRQTDSRVRGYQIAEHNYEGCAKRNDDISG